MPGTDKSIARTLLLAPSKQKWTNYQTHFHDFFAKRWPLFDRLITFTADFFATFVVFPTPQVYEIELTAAKDPELLDYVRTIAQDDLVLVHDKDADFAAALRTAKNQLFQADLLAAMHGLEEVITGWAAHLPAVQQGLNTMLAHLYTAQQRALGHDAAAETLLYGQSARQELRADYEAIKEKRRNGELYYELPFPKLADVRIKPGDLVFVGAYTSQGKSLLLRALAYHFLTVYGLNVAFFSLEMNLKAMSAAFSLLHANDKRIFPNTPDIFVDAYKEGRLTDEQEDFLMNVTNRDLAENPNYGVPLIHQPNKPAYALADLTERLRMIEQTVMPVHVLVIDYITLLNPVPSGRWAPVRPDDYNYMIKELKRLCLTHRDREGKPAPLICLTAAQISRKGLDEAMKRDSLYDLQAFSTYTEIERSADIAMTTLMTPEMRNARQLKLQILKNRDGVVPTEPLILNVDFPLGGRLRQLDQPDPVATLNTLRSLIL